MAHAQGHLRQRSPGSWTLTIFLGKDANGKPRQSVTTVRGTKRDAQRVLARMIADRDRGIDLRPERLTVAELAQRWLDSKKAGLAVSTAVSYDALLRIHVLPVTGACLIRDLKPLHIEAIKAAVTDGGGSQKLALNVYRVVNALLKQAVRWQLVSVNPCAAVDAPRPRRFKARVPTPEELDRLFVVADATQYGPLVRLAALSGARQGELLHLQWRDVDWQERRLTIPGTKTAASSRVLDVGPVGMALLSRCRSAERAKRLQLGPGATCGSDDATIFTNFVGRAADAGGLKRSWRRIVRDAAVGHVRFHDLRHASATYLLKAGVPVTVISQRLGHSRTSTTTDIYGHVMPGMGREAAEVLERQMVKPLSKAHGG
jgi:integrase